MNINNEKEYRAYPALSYSFLKELNQVGPKIILDGMDKKVSSGLTLGSLVDNLMTLDDYDWQDDFVITKFGLDFNGGTALDSILKHLYENPDCSVKEEDMLDLSERLGLWSKIKDRQKRIDRIFTEKFNEQYQLLSSIRAGKSIITEDDFTLALTMVDTLKSHRFTMDIFDAKPNVDIIYQVPVLYKIEGEDCKSLLDMVIVDHNSKRIYPNDLKTGAEKNFLKNFNRYEYYLQGAMYSLAIDDWKMQHGYDEYDVMPFKFIYISRANPYQPLVYEMDDAFILDHINGFQNIYNEYENGIIDLVKNYRWYIQNDIYDAKRHLHEQNGLIKLKNNKKLNEVK